MDQTAQTTSKPWYQKWWIWLIAAIIVIGGIGNLVDGDQEPTPTPTVEQTATPTPTDGPTEEPEPTTEPEAQPVAEDITNTILTDNGVKTFQGLDATSPGFWIADIEDTITGTIRVTIQDNLDAEGRDKTARWIANMTCTNVKTLDTIIIQDTTGRDSNHYLRDMPLPNTCKN